MAPALLSQRGENVILIVEDDDNDLFFAQRALSVVQTKAAIQIVRDGQQAMDYLAGRGQFSDRSACPIPHLVLLDLKLPYHSGLDVLAWRAHRPELAAMRVVVLTGSREPSDVRQAKELGADAFRTKPIKPQMIRDLAVELDMPWVLGAGQLAAKPGP